MYFKNIKKMQIDDLIKQGYAIYAHEHEGNKESLSKHTQLVTKYFETIVETKGFTDIFSKIEKGFFTEEEDEKKIFREMLYHIMTFHDIGKMNPNFQRKKMHNSIDIPIDKIENTDHSLLSAILYTNHFALKINEIKSELRDKLYDFLFLNAYIISRHHTGNDSRKSFLEKFYEGRAGEKLLSSESILYKHIFTENVEITVDIIERIFNERLKPLIENQSKEDSITKYIYERLILSLLFASDYYATMEFMDGIKTNYFGDLENIDEIYQVFRDGDICKSINTYKEKYYGKNQDFTQVKDINILRTELFLDAEKRLLENLEKNIFYLEAPTGSGKSNTAINLSFQLLKNHADLKRIIYIYPFNTLVEQNKDIIEKIFSNKKEILKQIAVINSMTAIKVDKKKTELDTDDVQMGYYKEALINKQFLNYPIVLSTHVTLFHYLFGTKKEDIFSLHQITNSVIVLDEIQSYKNSIWSEIITFLNAYSNILNIKIIIMSATLPILDKISLVKTDMVQLISNKEKYYGNKIFNRRVQADYTLLEAKSNMEEILAHVKSQSKNKKKILIEFISKKDAELFYKLLCENADIQSLKLLFTGDDNLHQRKIMVDTAKAKIDVILVATQVVEAGVDIDMDIGYKNISLLDSEEQFMGRINRSCNKKNSIVYFFETTEAKDIYKKDIRNNVSMTVKEPLNRIILEDKNFEAFYDKNFSRLGSISNKLTEMNINDFFKEAVGKQNYDKVQNRMTLIEDVDETSIFLNREIIINEERISGEKVWKRYRALLEDNKMEYAEKQVKLSEVTALLNNWVYKIKFSIEGKINFSWNDRIGDLYYIDDGENYMENGRVNRAKILVGELFI